MLSDFKDIIRVSGTKLGVYRGFTPYFLSSLINDIEVQSQPMVIQVLQLQSVMLCMDLILWNPLQILSNRMQNVDFGQKPSFLRSFKELMTKEGMSPIYRGYPFILIGLFIQQWFLRSSLAMIQIKGVEIFALPTHIFGCLISHPFMVIAKRV